MGINKTHVRDVSIQKALREALDKDKKLSKRDVVKIIMSTFDHGGISKQERKDLRTILKRSRTMSDSSRWLLGRFLNRLDRIDEFGGRVSLDDVGKEVTAVADNPDKMIDGATWFASAFRIGEVRFAGCVDMVEKVLKAAGACTITRLNLIDHGGEKSDGSGNFIKLGKDKLDKKNLYGWAPILMRLREKLDARGLVFLYHCHIGSDLVFMREIASLFGRPVHAGEEEHVHGPFFDFQIGKYVRANPDGTTRKGTGRPSTPIASGLTVDELKMP